MKTIILVWEIIYREIWLPFKIWFCYKTGLFTWVYQKDVRVFFRKLKAAKQAGRIPEDE